MGKYLIQYSKKAIRDLQMIKKSGRKSDRTKIDLFLLEMEESPRMGSGSPEQLKYFDGEIWSRAINKKDRLIYEIFEEEIAVVVIQALGHYNDK
ncbi:Txe/YoeB family addiction module toxin [Sphingobacterium siyangense]|uniref:Toxin YoeB n=1 Tax=Sphingobacterium siyangense TaxID=459529 RepID=A0A562MAQ0_9SPHI|nr:Txe/YoeB family addiction module toxin [Sphingobacterium siyangense]TWI17016.1 toxin YoeB [Sphingobacterium siyangense]